MTRIPHENRSVRGWNPPDDFSPPILEEVCSHPFCSVTGRENLELHELWPRSFLRGQPYAFVRLWDGTVVGNQVYLCNSFQNGHHQQITENKAQIAWLESARTYTWFVDSVGECVYRPLKPQPVLFAPQKAPNAKHPLYGTSPGGDAGYVLEGLTRASKFPATQEDVLLLNDHLAVPGQECPTCHRKVPVEKKKEKARNRVSKSIRVPKDEQENGVEVLEDMMEQVEEILRPGEKPRSPYYTLTDALGLVIVNKDVIL